jgi:hypothetical protein
VRQDGYEYRASTVRVIDDVGGAGPNHVVEQGPGYSSTLDITMDAD